MGFQDGDRTLSPKVMYSQCQMIKRYGSLRRGVDLCGFADLICIISS